jgi:hypothetical protein
MSKKQLSKNKPRPYAPEFRRQMVAGIDEGLLRIEHIECRPPAEETGQER